MTFYRQCRMQKIRGLRTSWRIAWIPEQLAVKGKYLKIEEDNGWLVVVRGRRRLEESVLNDSEYRHHRNVTDI